MLGKGKNIIGLENISQLPTDKLYACEYKIKILDEKNRDRILNFFNEFDWNGFTNGIAMKRLKQFHIIDILKKQFPELK